MKIRNAKRGCGHLKTGAMYLHAEVSPDGILPPFVLFDPPLRYDEQEFRGWKAFQGLQFEMAFRPETRLPGFDEEAYRADYRASMAPRPTAEFIAAIGGQETELDRHVARLCHEGYMIRQGQEIPGLGYVRHAWAPDLLMFIGATYYPTPDDFVKEAIRLGVNKRIPNTNPPLVIPGITKLYLVHPAAPLANGDIGPAVIGFAYMTHVIFTRPPDNVIPKWVDDLRAVGQVTIADIGDEETDDPNTNLQGSLLN
jgi:hypothetical protein